MKPYLLHAARGDNCIVLQATKIDFAIVLPCSWQGDPAFGDDEKCLAKPPELKTPLREKLKDLKRNTDGTA